MKRFLSFILCAALLMALCVPAFAATVGDFTDVSKGTWFYDYVRFVTEKGMFNGTGANTFSPQSTMTRGMFVTVLGRYGGAPATVDGSTLGVIIKDSVNMRSGPSTVGTEILDCLPLNAQVEYISSCPDSNDPNLKWNYILYKGTKGYIRNDLIVFIDSGFTDVPATAYYRPYVQWAFSNGIAYESGAGTFSPEAPISREEICSMLFNYSSYKNLALKGSIPAKTFTDSAHISGTHKTAVSKMQQLGVVDGYEDGSFKPAGSATRAEVSAILKRYIDATSYKPETGPSTDGSGNYVYGADVPSAPTVDSSYFSDACFIGHSLVVGMKSYLNLGSADFLCFNGARAKSLMDYDKFELKTTHKDEEGNEVPDTGTLSQALGGKSYGKVYIMLGANECGSSQASRDAFYANMSVLINLVRTKQPEAKIYLISMTPVTKALSESNATHNRDNLVSYNVILRQLCRDLKLYYLNIFDTLADSDGFLPQSGAMSDGLHLLGPQYTKIKSYLLTHAIQ